VITPNRTYRRRVHQQSTVFSTEQEAIIKAIWLTEGRQRDKGIITDSLSTLTAINGNNHNHEQADEEAKAARDDDLQQNEE
jgi:hypothetical protein